MEIRDEGDFYGITVILVAGDQIEDVPSTHRHLVSEKIRNIFVDPLADMRSIIERCPFEQMSNWLAALCDADQWELELWIAEESAGRAGFNWSAENVREAFIGPAKDGDLWEGYPAELRTYYELVDAVDWMGVAESGGLHGGTPNVPDYLSLWNFPRKRADIDFDETFIWGDSPCGNMLIWTSDGRAGWYNLGSHDIEILGSIGDTINWVFTELLEDRCPDWSKDWYS